MFDWILTIYDSIIEFIGISFAFLLACLVAFFAGYAIGLDHGEESQAQVIYIPKPEKAKKSLLNTRPVRTKDVK